MLRKLSTIGLLVPLGVAVAHVPTPAQELTRDQVLERYYEAVGGLEAWDAVESLKATGTITLGQGMQAPFTVLSKRPKKVRIEFEVQGMEGVQAYDGETAWMFMPFGGQTEPQKMSGSQATNLQEEADFDGPLMGWEEEGHEVTLMGKDTVDGTAAYRLDVKRANGRVQRYYLDAEYFLPIKITGTREIQGAEVEYETDLGDYKQVGALMMAHSIESSPAGGSGGGQSVRIDSVELNHTVPDSVFTMPADGGSSGGGGR